MKLIKFLYSLFFIYLISIGVVLGKALPPGTGIGDVPSNVLIMLDKSGSMGWRMSGGTNSLFQPHDTAVDTNGDLYVGQGRSSGIKKVVYTSGEGDKSWGVNGVAEKNSTCKPRNLYSLEIHNNIIYAVSYSTRNVIRYNQTTGMCIDTLSVGGYPIGMGKYNKGGTTYIGVSTWSGYVAINTSTGSVKQCAVNTNVRRSYMIAGSDAQTDFIYTYRGSRIYKWSVGNDGCPGGSVGNMRFRAGNDFGGLELDESDNNILYHLSWGQSKFRKVNFGSKSVVWTKGSRNASPTTASRTYFWYPFGVTIDTNNNRLIASGINKYVVQVFDMNGTWIKSFGGAPKTRMQAAHEAIQAIMRDNSLTSGVNFGFGKWASGTSKFNSWSKPKNQMPAGRASPCSNNNCLMVPITKASAPLIDRRVKQVSPGGGTDARAFSNIAKQYYNSSWTPIDPNSPCQNSYVLVIGDGDWVTWSHSNALKTARDLKAKGVKTFAVAFGTGISSGGLTRFNELADAGGTTQAIRATTAAALKSELKAAIMQIIAAKLSFTAPAITATIEQSGSLFQAQFDYRQGKEWAGTITRTKIDQFGNLDENDSGNWSAVEEMPSPDNRKIWSVGIPNTDYKTDYNNFIPANATDIDSLFGLYQNGIGDYHRATDNEDGTSNNRECAGRMVSAGQLVADNTDDDAIGLIEFVRGKDFFDYDGDCAGNADGLTETRANPLGDIYHSQLVVVGPPSADTAFVGNNQEAYYRSLNGYSTWANSANMVNRKEVIYAGSNSGILHAFESETGKELWGFVPPLIAPNLPLVINRSLNQQKKGGSNAIFGVDGSIVVHDMYFKSPLGGGKDWHTILFVPYGRGGPGYSVLDITDPEKPLHLWSIYNDTINNKVFRVDHNENIFSYDYIARSYSLSSFAESLEVTDYYNSNSSDPSYSSTCQDTRDSSGDVTSSCYKSQVWTFPVQNVTKSDLKVEIDGSDYTNFDVGKNSNGDTTINFKQDITYSADVGDTNTSTQLGVYIATSSITTGVQAPDAHYDYSRMGETWSDPRIFRIPNNGAGDIDINDDIYVAAMGGGFGTQFEGVGSNLMIINLEDNNNPGMLLEEVYKYNQKLTPPSASRVLDIEDLAAGDIVNSTPASPVLITPDTARGLEFNGALLYINDLEGKITKFNLSNMSGSDGTGNNMKTFDSTTLFTSGSTRANGRYMYHAMDATIGGTTNQLWLFAGTGDYTRINDETPGVENFLIGIKDKDYPKYKVVNTASNADDISECTNTTNNFSSPNPNCPKKDDRGWYIKLPDFAKVTAEPTVYKGLAYFPIYQPDLTSLDRCTLGNAFICGVDDECGTNVSSQLGNIRSGEVCFYVGQGILSKIVVFADKLFANIAGQSTGNKKDLVEVKAGQGTLSTYRSSWKENY